MAPFGGILQPAWGVHEVLLPSVFVPYVLGHLLLVFGSRLEIQAPSPLRRFLAEPFPPRPPPRSLLETNPPRWGPGHRSGQAPPQHTADDDEEEDDEGLAGPLWVFTLLKRRSCGLLQQLDPAAGSGQVLQDILTRYNGNDSMLSGGLDTTVTKTAGGRTLRRKNNNNNQHHHHHNKNKPHRAATRGSQSTTAGQPKPLAHLSRPPQWVGRL